MYSIHFIETATKFSTSYNSIAEQKNKNMEVNMEKNQIQKSASKTKIQNQPNHPVNH